MEEYGSTAKVCRSGTIVPDIVRPEDMIEVTDNSWCAVVDTTRHSTESNLVVLVAFKRSSVELVVT
jgi:membrane protein implicated in regulation of membrane protease activity